MAGWATLKELVEQEFRQAAEEGKDASHIEALRPEWRAAGEDEQKLQAVLAKLQSLPVSSDFPFDEPSDLAGIRSKRPSGIRRKPLGYGEEVLFDRSYGAWLGRCAGCALGKPIEGFMSEHLGLVSKDRIKLYLTAIDPSEWPLNNYIPQQSPAQEKTGKANCPLSTREQIMFMESDDDIQYTVIGQKIFTSVGRDFSTYDMMQLWLNTMPYRWVCTAETQAYRNFALRYQVHQQTWQGLSSAQLDKEVDWAWVATNENPYREWIGAQIRADHFGYAAPGNMELAAEFAWRDARMSHVKNGIYGEMFVAAMVAAAYIYDDPQAIIDAGLAEIPATSRLYHEMKQVIDICHKHNNDPVAFEAVHEEIYKLLGHYNCVHTNNNAALVVAALLLGGHDFEKVITIAVMGGWDTDCNGATAGSIAGAMLGAGKLPKKWTAPLNDTLNSLIAGYHPIAISECARRSVTVAKNVAEAK